MEISGKTVSIGYVNARMLELADEPRIIMKQGEGNYPAVDQVYPKSTDKKAQVALSIPLLRKLLTCLPDTGTVVIGLNEPHEAVEFCTRWDDSPTHGLIMPMFMELGSFTWPRGK
jgi:hypothetical protein